MQYFVGKPAGLIPVSLVNPKIAGKDRTLMGKESESKGEEKTMDGKLRNMTSIYLSNGNQMLLLFRQGGRVVNNLWTGSAGGHFEEFELNDARACVLRELKEELGINETALENLALRYITLRRTRGEIRQNYYFFAKLAKDADKPITSKEGICKWFEYSELPALEMPYTAKFVIAHYLETGHRTDALYVGVADGGTVIFTELPEFIVNDINFCA